MDNSDTTKAHEANEDVLTRARAREGHDHGVKNDDVTWAWMTPWQRDLVEAPPVDWRQLAGALKRGARRLHWRACMATRNSTIARALRVAEQALGARFVRRVREAEEWILFGRTTTEGEVRAIAVHVPVIRKLVDYSMPVTVTVLRPDIVDLSHIIGVCPPGISGAENPQGIPTSKGASGICDVPLPRTKGA